MIFNSISDKYMSNTVPGTLFGCRRGRPCAGVLAPLEYGYYCNHMLKYPVPILIVRMYEHSRRITTMANGDRCGYRAEHCRRSFCGALAALAHAVTRGLPWGTSVLQSIAEVGSEQFVISTTHFVLLLDRWNFVFGYLTLYDPRLEHPLFYLLQTPPTKTVTGDHVGRRSFDTTKDVDLATPPQRSEEGYRGTCILRQQPPPAE